MQQKKKFNWKFWLFLLLPFAIAAYIAGGIFCFKDLSFAGFQQRRTKALCPLYM